jgi:hypothetical protein
VGGVVRPSIILFVLSMSPSIPRSVTSSVEEEENEFVNEMQLEREIRLFEE